MTLLLSSCGLRLETADPEALVPDEVEVVRQRTTADAVALGTLATAAGGDAPPAALSRVAQVGRLHVTALGGVYTWEPPAPQGAPEPSREPTSTPGPVTPEDVAASLEETAASARADAASVADPEMARLLASVATSRLLLADAVRVEAGLEVQPHAPFEVPAQLPPGTGPSTLTPVVQSEDALGMAWEVAAARVQDGARAAAARRAAQHRGRAEAWALLTEVDATGLDPRRSAYDLPDELVAPASDAATTAEVLRGLERDLAASYASLVAAAQGEGRSALVDALVDTARHGWPASAAPPAFPGMPEQET